MKKIIYISIISLIFILSIFITTNQSIAAFSIDGFIGDADAFIEAGKTEGENAIDQTGLKEISDVIYNTLLAVGLILAVAVGLFLGIKIMIGSIEEQAQYKELLIPYFIGCIVVFGGFGIWKLVVTILQRTL